MRILAPRRARAVAVLLGLVLCACVEASSGVVVVVAAGEPVPELSPAQIEDIFLGRSNRFPDGRPAMPIDRSEGSPVRQAFYSEVLGRTLAQVKAHWSKIIFTGRGRPPRQLASADELRKLLRDNPAAISYMLPDEIDDSVRVVAAR